MKSKTAAPRRTHRERVEQSDRLMLDAAKSLILERGTHATTLQEIGERAGYSRGLAHARFGSKENLFLRLTEDCVERWFREVRASTEGGGGLVTLFSRLDAVVSYTKKLPEEATVLYVLWFESVGISSPIRDRLSDFHTIARSDIEQLLVEAIERRELEKETNVEALTLLVTSAIFGVAYQWLVNPKAIQRESAYELLRTQIELLLKKT